MDISKIKALSKKKEDENWALRFYLKSSDVTPEKIDDIAHELYKKISSRIDCKICGSLARTFMFLKLSSG
jgi:hypothetical protein